MSKSADRRTFLRDSALVALGGAAVAGAPVSFSKEALAAQRNISINTDAKALMPDGKMKTRTELMTQLGLDPTTPPDAWLSITSCGSNAAALTGEQMKSLQSRGLKLEPQSLKVKGLQ
jgi:hypothetical protein